MNGEGPFEVSVILAVRNGEPYLRFQLEALARQECTFAWELIVVDNGSTDGTAATTASFQSAIPHLQLLHEPVPGKSRALNRGMAAATGRLFVFVDADDEAGEDYLQRMAESLAQFDVVGARLDTKRLNPWCASGDMVVATGIPVYHGFRPAIPGCILGIRAELCERIGPYDEGLMSAEDVDYSWRASALGATFGRQLDAVMYVRRPPNSWAAFKKSRSYAHSAVWLYERYRSQGMQRRSFRQVFGPMRWKLRQARRKEGPWMWSIGWESGTIVGRMEESIRRRVLFP